MNFQDGVLSIFDTLTEVSDNYIYIGDMKTGVFRYSPHQVNVFRLPDEVVEKPLEAWKEIVHPQDWDAFYQSNLAAGKDGNDLHSVEFRARTYDGEYIWLKCRGRVMRDGNGEPMMIVGIMTELGQKNKSGSLKNLRAREVFEKRIKAESRKQDAQFAILKIDIDNLKIFNEMYNRVTGDFIIQKVTALVKKVFDEKACQRAYAYKLEANLLGVMIKNTTREEISALYSEIQIQISRELSLKAFDYPVHVSAGCVFYPEDTAEYPNLIPYGELALHEAKDLGRNRLVFYSAPMLDNRKRRFELFKYLDRSIKNHYQGFEVHYQPQIDAKSRKIKGVEALLRWRCAERGSVSPVEFVPVLEESGLIIPVGLWVIRKVIADCREWIAAQPDFMVSINVSLIQITDSDFITDVKKIVEAERISPANIILELTESSMIENTEVLKNALAQLRALGFKIAIDDFGTGYSSLGILKTLRADVVKIDKIFVQDILSNREDKIFIETITTLCHCIGMKVLLEGVETEDEFAAVKPMGLDYIQGYLFGRPQEAARITERLTHTAEPEGDRG